MHLSVGLLKGLAVAVCVCDSVYICVCVRSLFLAPLPHQPLPFCSFWKRPRHECDERLTSEETNGIQFSGDEREGEKKKGGRVPPEFTPGEPHPP